MSESLKAVCALVLIVMSITTAYAWHDPAPSEALQVCRYLCPLLAVGSLAVLVASMLRRDLAPDYLALVSRGYYNRDGFCFTVGTEARDGVCWVVFGFQNQRDSVCVGQVAIRPARGFFLGRAEFVPVAVRIRCGPAAFGTARVPVPVPAALQGRRQGFEVGASVSHPSGRGQRLRFRDGILLRANSDFGNGFGKALTVAATMTGHIHYESPAAVTLDLPDGVAEELPEGLTAEVETHWELGDPPLDEAADG